MQGTGRGKLALRVDSILKDLQRGINQKWIAKKYKVTRSSISRINVKFMKHLILLNEK